MTCAIAAGFSGAGVAYADSFAIDVAPTCGFRTIAGANAGDISYTGNGIAGQEVVLNNDGKHNFNVYCNNETGYKVTAKASHLINESTGSTISYTNDYKKSADDGEWTAEIKDGDENATVAGPNDTPSTIKSNNDMTAAAGDAFSVLYKIYIGSKTKTGTYTGTATYTVSPNPVPGLSNGRVMQYTSAANCANTEMYNPDDPDATTFSLKDSRTNHSYLVRRLADGNCWMVQNLWLEAGTTYVNGSSLGNTLVIPEESTNIEEDWDEEQTKKLPLIYQGTHQDAAADAADNTGSYFNWMMATAGTGNYTGEFTLVSPVEGLPNIASDSVCPRGWKLPTGGVGGQFRKLYNDTEHGYAANFAKMENAWNSGYAVGYYDYDGINEQGSYGYWWSSDFSGSRSGPFNFTIYQTGHSFYPDSNDQYNGYSVRCVLVAQ